MTSPAGKGERGFSLLELILVLMLFGMSALVVLPSLGKGLKSREARQAALGFAAAARELESKARSEGVPQGLVVDRTRNSYRTSADREVVLPANLSIAGVEGGEMLENGLTRFSFYPNGAAFGGRVDFAAGANSIAYSVRFHPLTGRVEVLRGASE